MGHWFREFLTPEYVPHFKKSFPCFREAGQIDGVQFLMRRADGGTIRVSFNGRIGFAPDGSFDRTHCILHDITEEYDTLQALRDSERRLRETQELARVGWFERDLDTDEGRWSEQTRELFGIGPEVPVPDEGWIRAHVHPDDRAGFDACMHAARGKGAGFDTEFRIVRDDGQVRHTACRATLDTAPDGREIRIRGMLQDVTRRKRAEEQMRVVFENAPLGMFTSTLEGRFERVNPALAHILGFATPEEVLAEVDDIAADLYVDPSRREEVVRLLRANPRMAEFENEYRRKGGGTFIGLMHLSLLPPELGGPKLLGLVQDVTEQRRALAELAESEERYHSLFRYAPVGIYQSTPGGRYITVNPAFAQMHGYDGPEQVLAEVTDISGQLYEDPGRRAEMLRELEAAGEVHNFEVRSRRRDGSLFWSLRSVRLMRDEAGRPHHLKGFIMDVTRQKELEIFREDVARIVRHDLKSPLISALAGLKLVRMEGPLAPSQAELLDEVSAGCARMLATLDLSLTLARIENGEYDPGDDPVDLAGMLREVSNGLAAAFASRRVGVDLAPCEACTVPGEAQLIRNMLENLVKNALEATPENTRIQCSLTADGGDALVRIHNLGAVPEDIRGCFFDKYVSSGKRFGTGLGAYSALLVARAHGGDITADCTDADTTLTVHLPLARPAQHRPQVGPS